MLTSLCIIEVKKYYMEVKTFSIISNYKISAARALSQTPKNVSEPQTGIEPTTFRSPVRRSND